MRWLTRISILLLFIVAASVVWWLDNTREREPQITPTAAAAELPDYYLTAFRAARYTAPGAPREILHGEHLEHYPLTATAEIRRPRVVHQPAEAVSWRIRADSATLLETPDIVQMHGDVRLRRPAADGVREFTLLTARLTYAMDPEIASTDAAVRMRSPGTHVDAVGMTARLARDEVDLLDRVRVRHDPVLARGDAGDD